jgi:NAD-reducing hydrogenase large subunit
MTRTVTIDPLTRVEGHGKITIQLDERGEVTDAKFHVTQFRGFEKLCEGRPYYEMPSLMERICGICPVSHSLASAKACDALLGVRIPPTAVKLRRALTCGQFIQSHALSFFHLSGPDLVLGMDAEPERLNIFGLMESRPEIALAGVKLRKIGQTIIELLAGKRIHPSVVVPGGVNAPLTADRRDEMLKLIPEAMEIVLGALSWFKASLEDHRPEIRTFANFPSMFMGLVDEKGNLELMEGNLRFIDYKGNKVADQVAPKDYQEYLAEAVEPWSFLKSPYFKALGYPEGIYRAGPAARLNVCEGCGTPLADQEWAEFRSLERGPVLSSFHNHYARLVEILYCIETLNDLLNDPEILLPRVRASAQPNFTEGVGVVEAPRGTLFHHYRVDDHGLMTWANLIVATGNNNLAMNRGVLQTAKQFVHGREITNGALNRVEAVIRTFDPCLSCSTHAVGTRSYLIQILGKDGEVLNEIR